MNPAFSIILFTTLAGAAQGLVCALAVADLLGAGPQTPFKALALGVAFMLLAAALTASFFHLGHPMRAWRAAAMWRSSWMSREVIVLPVFMGVVAAWGAGELIGLEGFARVACAVLSLLLAALLWYCTAMIYACLRFIQEWAHPITLVNYVLIGLASGLVLAGALGALAGEADFARGVAPWALTLTLLAWATRAWALRRNAGLKPKSTLQSATGIHAARLAQQSMGMSAGAFNTREFFHEVSLAMVRRIKLGFQLLGFAAPACLVALTLLSPGGAPTFWTLAVALQLAGVLAERWLFFAQARHPQNLYYQVVS